MSQQEPTSEIYRINKQLCNFSPDGKFLALAYQSNVIIKNAANFETFQRYSFVDVVEQLSWSPDSEYILCWSIKKVIVQIFSICFPDWKFKLTEGSAGIENVLWTPDSKHIITFADFRVQLSIWSLLDQSVSYIQNLKSYANKSLEFSPNGKHLAVIVSSTGQDNVEIYRTKDWKLSRKLICDGLTCIDGLCWSPNSELMSIWCAISGEAKLIIYSHLSENHVGIFSPAGSNCALHKELRSSEFDEKLKGLEIIKWMPSGQLIAVAGTNETIVLLNCLTWNPIQQLTLDPVVKGSNYLAKVFKETTVIVKDQKDGTKSTTSIVKHTFEELGSRPIIIPIAKRELPNSGDASSICMSVIDILEFSACGQYLAIRHQIYPWTLWIWDIRTNGLDILFLQKFITGIKWESTRARLLIFSESTHFCEWTPNTVSSHEAAREMAVLDARWHPSGKFAVLCGFNRAAIYRFNCGRRLLPTV